MSRAYISQVPREFCRARCNAWHESPMGGWCGHGLFHNPERVCLASVEDIAQWRKRSLRPGAWPNRSRKK